MISDGELFKLIINKYPKEPIPFIVEQFMIFKFCLIQAEKKNGFPKHRKSYTTANKVRRSGPEK